MILYQSKSSFLAVAFCVSCFSITARAYDYSEPMLCVQALPLGYPESPFVLRFSPEELLAQPVWNRQVDAIVIARNAPGPIGTGAKALQDTLKKLHIRKPSVGGRKPSHASCRCRMQRPNMRSGPTRRKSFTPMAAVSPDRTVQCSESWLAASQPFGLSLRKLEVRLVSTSIALLAIASPLTATEPENLADMLQPYVERHELAGAVTMVVSKDKVLDLKTVGYSDISAEKPMGKDALFWLASMTKPMTATALMMLVDEGKVGLDDPVEKYLPQFTPRIMAVTDDGTHVHLQVPRQPITVRNLLDHTNGTQMDVGHIFSPSVDAHPLTLRVESLALMPLQFEPGSDYAYGWGLDIAARVIEVVSGLSYEEFMQRRLFDPLGMTDTTFWPSEAQVERLAKAYTRAETGAGLEEASIRAFRYPLTDRAHRYPLPSAGLFSTAHDIGKFARMILNGGSLEGRHYLSQAAIREMSRNQLSGKALESARKYLKGIHHPAALDGYGLGWATSSSGAFGHEGAYATSLRIDPKQGIATIWMTQNAGAPGGAFDKAGNVFQQTAVERFGLARGRGESK